MAEETRNKRHTGEREAAGCRSSGARAAAHRDRGRRVGAGHRARPADRLVPGRGVHAGRPGRHVLRRADHRLGAGVRARHLRRPLLRLPLPHAAGRGGHGRPADPRQHAPRGHLDRAPGDHDARRSASTRPSSCTTPRRRPPPPTSPSSSSASSASSSPGPSTTSGRRARRQGGRLQPALPPRGPVRPLQRPDQGRPARLLGPRLPLEDRRGARHHHRLPGDAQPHRRPTPSSAPSCAASATP